MSPAIAWIKSAPASAPFLAWVHLYDAHLPYSAPAPYRAKFAARPYDGEISEVDAQVGRLLEELESRGLGLELGGALLDLALEIVAVREVILVLELREVQDVRHASERIVHGRPVLAPPPVRQTRPSDAAEPEGPERAAEEISQLLYHTQVLMIASGITLDDVLVEDGRIAPFSTTDLSFTAMGRFGNVMLVNGEPRYRLAVKRGEVVRFHLTNAASARFLNLSFGGAVWDSAPLLTSAILRAQQLGVMPAPQPNA